MHGLGTYLVSLQLGLGVFALVFCGIAFVGLTGRAPMVISSLLLLAAWLFLVVLLAYSLRLSLPLLGGGDQPDDAIAWTRRALIAWVVVAPVTGLGLAFVAFIDCGPAWIPGTYHWLGLAATVLGLLALFTQPPVVSVLLGRNSPSAGAFGWWVVLLTSGLVALLWALAWLVPYLMLRGSVDEARYAAARADLLLPFPGGEDSWVIQGNNSGFNHNSADNLQEFSWDFRRPCGTPVLAALPGTVSAVVDTNDGIGGPNNLVSVTHADGTEASYLHIRRGSAAVAVGQAVVAGDQLAQVGCVGNSLTGHIHFMVRSGAATVAVRFADVHRDGGIPRAWGSYTSGNR